MALLYGLPAKNIVPLEHAQNTAARIVSGTKKTDDVTSVLSITQFS